MGTQFRVKEGGTGARTLTDNGILYGNGANPVAATAAGTEGQLWVANSSGIPAPVTVSGDATLAASGALTLDAGVLAADATGRALMAADFFGTTAVADDKFATGVLGEDLLTAAELTGRVVAVLADAAVIGGIPVIHMVNTAGGATADTTVTLTHKTRVLYAFVINRAAGTGSDTITVKNTTTAITDAIDISGADKTIKLAATIDDAQWDIAAGGTLRITETDGGGSDSPATTVVLLCVRVA